MKLGIVGSPAGIPTYCKVIDKNGKISTSFCYDNATIKIDHNTKVYNNQK